MAMTMGKDEDRDSLKFILKGNVDEFDKWGHEYVSNLSGEISQEYQHRLSENPDLHDSDCFDLLSLVNKILPYLIKSNSEPEACDLLLDTEKLDQILDFVDNNNYSRVCNYLNSISKFQLEPDNIQIQKIVYNIYKRLEKYPEAIRMAIQLNDYDLIRESFYSCPDKLIQKQMAFMLGRHSIKLKRDDEDIAEEDDEEISDLMGNNRLSEHFNHLAKELDSVAPKHPEDIYKSHLTETRSTLTQNIDSARQNLASTFVNAFVNSSYGTDKLMTDEGTKWLYKNKDHGMMSAAASLGMIYLWNQDEGLGEVDKYMYSGEDYIKGGALLAIGVIHSSLRNQTDAAYALLSDHVEGGKRDLRIGAILGLGIAYAGSGHEEVNDLLMPILADAEQPVEISAFAALALGLVFVGTGNDAITEAIFGVLMEREEKDLTHPLARFFPLALGFLFLGKQEAADSAVEASKTLNAKIAQYTELTIATLAYTGTGNVLKVQELLRICGEHIEEGKENKHQGVATLGIALIAMGEELGSDMAIRSFDHLLQYSDVTVKRAVPLAIGLLNVSNPKMSITDTLSKLSHDADAEVAEGAILALGLIGAGTNNARIAQLLRQLSSYYAKEANHLFMVRLAQGLLFMGKGLISLSPYYSDRALLQPSALCGLLTLMHSALDLKNTILAQYHYLFYTLSISMYPRMLITVDEELNPLPVSVRVGQAVDTVAQAGRPKTITGFQTHNTPVILAYDDRAELATEEYIPLTSVLEGVVILKKNPEYVA
jgi:26S proteasome regulatory subunit N1